MIIITQEILLVFEHFFQSQVLFFLEAQAMKQKIFMLIIFGLFLSFFPSVSAESDAEFLGRMLAEAPIAASHPTDWVQQVEVLETVPEKEEQGDDDEEGDYEDDGCDDDYGEYEDDGECEFDYGCGDDMEANCEDGEDNGQWGGCVDEPCGDDYDYEDYCDDAKVIGTSSVILAATLIINFVL